MKVTWISTILKVLVDLAEGESRFILLVLNIDYVIVAASADIGSAASLRSSHLRPLFATSSDSYSSSNPCNLLLLVEYLDTVHSQPNQGLDQQRHSASSSAKICVPWLAFSRAKRRSATELEEARVGCVYTLGCKSGCSTTRKIASNPGDTCTSGIAKVKSFMARTCVWWASLDADLEPKCEPVPSVSQVDPQN